MFAPERVNSMMRSLLRIYDWAGRLPMWANVVERAAHYGYQKDWAWKRGVVLNGTWWNSLTMLEVLKRLGSDLT